MTKQKKSLKDTSIATTVVVQPAQLEQQFAELVRVVNLREVRLVDMQAKVATTQIDANHEGAKLINHPVQTRAGLVKSSLYCGVKLGIKIATSIDTPGLVDVAAEYALLYDIPENNSFSAEVINLFASRNAVFNVWPFFRELVHSTIGRMGLPPLTLASFRLSATPR